LHLVTAPAAQALFQVAVVLIPALLFAGGLVRQTDDKATTWPAQAAACLMVLVVIVAVVGELVAINAAFAVSPSGTSIRIVVTVLAVGTIAIGLRTARHWVDGVVSKRAATICVYLLGLAAGVLAVVGTEIVVTNTIRDAQAAQALTVLQAATTYEQSAHGRAARDAARNAVAIAQRDYQAACRAVSSSSACTTAAP
jgi:nitrate reductase gamma subunit